ncbi:MAG: phospholipase D-like domain-containing protein [Nanoarchaeota archaeon]|nr:phospholipase D-like domain-containing protein [Nanoarchaeota archaeon]
MKREIVLIIILGLLSLQIATGYYLFKDIPSEKVVEPKIYFCPFDNCVLHLAGRINNAKHYVYCAFFDLDLEEIIHSLSFKDIDVKMVLDDDCFKEFRRLGFVRKDDSKQLMHNKFCVIDDKYVMTGSFNPTYNGNFLNNNNLLIIESEYLAKNYKSEFNELWQGHFSGGNKVKYPKVNLNNHLYENYFCPEDGCEEKVLEALASAEKSIYFMTFSFTSKKIADFFVKNKNRIEIKGVFEKFQNGKYSQYSKLQSSGLNVKFDQNPKNMHHKVFIIDEKIVITGSYNPTASGNSRNDENILIIHDAAIAKRFVEEFYRIW